MARQQTPLEASKAIPEPEPFPKRPQRPEHKRGTGIAPVPEEPQKLVDPTPEFGFKFGGVKFGVPITPEIEQAATRIIPSTGEPFYKWLDRRFDKISQAAPGFGPTFALEVAMAPISDEEVAGLIGAVTRSNELFNEVANDQRREGINESLLANIFSKKSMKQARADALKDIKDKIDIKSPQDLDKGAEMLGFKNFLEMTVAYSTRATQTQVEGIGGIDSIRLATSYAEASSDEEILDRARATALLLTRNDESDEAAQRQGFDSFDDLVDAQVDKFAQARAEAEEVSAPKRALAGALEGASFGLEPLEKVYRQLIKPVGVAALYAQEAAEVVASPLTNLIEKVRPGTFAPDVLKFNPPAPDKALGLIEQYGPGRALMIQGGATPGSVEFQVGSVVWDGIFRMYLDPGNILGKAGKGIRQARRVIGPDESLRGIARWTNRLAQADSVEALFQTRQGRKGVTTLFDDISRIRKKPGEFNLIELRQRWSLHESLLEPLSQAKSADEVQDILISTAHGRVPGQTIARAKGQIQSHTEEINALEHALRTGQDISLPEGLTPQQAIASLKTARGQLQSMVDSGVARGILREIPQNTMLGRLRANLRRPDLDTNFGKVLSFFTDPNWHQAGEATRRRARGKLPKPFSLSDKNGSVDEFRKMGQIAGLDVKQLDEFSNRFLRATSQSEMYHTLIDMMATGKKNFPGAFAANATQIWDTPGNLSYWFDDAGRQWDSWSYVDDKGVPHPQPLLSTQRLSTVPMTGIAEMVQLRSYLGRMKTFLRGFGKSQLSKQVATAGPVVGFGLRTAPALASVIQGTQDAVHHAIGFWAGAMLMRAGWAVKITSEGFGRLLAVGVSPLEDSPLSIFGRAATPKMLERSRRAIGPYALVAEALDDISVPDEVMARYGGNLFERRATATATVKRGQKGHIEATQDTLAQLHAAPEIRQLVRSNKDDTVNWLLNDITGREVLDDQLETIFKVHPEITDAAEAARIWVNELDEAVTAAVGTSDTMRRALRDGYLKQGKSKIRISDEGFKDLLRGLDESDLPLHARASGEAWKYADEGLYRRGTQWFLNNVGAFPDNKLNRIPAYKFFYKAERSRLRKLGVDDKLAHASARAYAIKQNGEILFDGAQRSAGDVQVRTFLAFFPAYKEVMTRWLGAIPAAHGAGIGYPLLARRAQVFWNAATADGLAVKNDEGEWELQASALDKFVEYALNIKGLKAAFPFATLGLITGLPGFTPVALAGLKLGEKFFGDSKAYADFLKEVTNGFGVKLDFGPVWAARVLKSVGIDAPWRLSNKLAQDQTYSNAVIDILRTEMADDLRQFQDECGQAEAKKAGAKFEHVCAEKGRNLWQKAGERADGLFLRRGLFGFFSPWQPRLIWPGQEEADKFREAMEFLPANTEDTFMDLLRQQNPNVDLFLIAKTHIIKGEEAREGGRDAWWQDTLEGARASLGADWPLFAIGAMDYNEIRRNQRRQLADLGGTAVEWLQKGSEYRRIQRETGEAIDRLKRTNETWWNFTKTKWEAAAIKDGSPLPDIEEEIAMELARNADFIAFKFNDPFDPSAEVGQAAKDFAVNLRNHYNLDQFYSDQELEGGPERDIAKYLSGPVADYWESYASIRDKYIDGKKSAASKRQGYDLLTKLRNEATAVIDGVEFPHPEEYSYLTSSPEQQRSRRQSWAMGRVEWLAPYQRKYLGLPESEDAVQYWGLVEQARETYRAFIDKHDLAGNRAKALTNQIETWAQAFAKANNLDDEYKLSQQLPYQRALEMNKTAKLRLKTPGFERVVQVADHYNNILEAAETTPASKTGEIVLDTFRGWLTAFTEANPATEEVLNEFFLSAPTSFQKSYDVNFVPFFFFGVTGAYGA